MENLYDDIKIDIARKHKEINSLELNESVLNKVNIVKSSFDKLLFYAGTYQKMIDSGLYRDWFDVFNKYWQEGLGGRPLYFHDFFFLYSNYRRKFQSLGVSSDADKHEFLNAYQDHTNIYSTFGAVYKYSLSPFQYYPFLKYIQKGQNILEFGSGIAPIIAGLIKYEGGGHNYTIADIPQFTHHYAKWLLKPEGVKCIDLEIGVLPDYEKKFDAIFMMTVLEHLPNPLETIKHLTENLKSGGYIMFDYILSDADGLDTKEGLEQRGDVLRYINENYTIEMGEIKFNQSMGRTAAKKK